MEIVGPGDEDRGAKGRMPVDGHTVDRSTPTGALHIHPARTDDLGRHREMVNPHLKLFEVARLYALCYTLMRESHYRGNMLFTRLLADEAGSIDWEALGKLVKFAISYVMSKGPLH
jgi:hypothetical protein